MLARLGGLRSNRPAAEGEAVAGNPVLAFVLAQPELLVVVLLAVAAYLVPGNVRVGPISGWTTLPLAVMVLGITQGAPLAMQAMGTILVYRSNRIINFAQVALGVLSGYLFYNLMAHREFIYLLGKVGVQIGQDVRYAPYNLQILNLVLSFLVCFVAGPLVGFLVYFGIIRLFEKVPPLMVTVATIGIAGLLPVLVHHIGDLNGGKLWPDDTFALQYPIDTRLIVGTTHFHLAALSAVVFVILASVAMWLFLRFSALGVTLRAAADNISRVRTLGVNPAVMLSVVWVLAATLSGLAAILTAEANKGGQAGGGGIQSSVMVRILAVAVIARLSSLPMAVVAAFALEIIEQSLVWNLSDPSIFEGLLLVMITAFLLMQRQRKGRSDTADERFPAAVEVRPIPAELKDHFVVKRYVRLGALGVLVMLLGYPWVGSPGQVDTATVGMIYAMIGLALLVLTGWTGQISLGHFAFVGVGGYVSAILFATLHWPMPFAIVAAAVVGAVVAALVGLPALRLPGLYLAVVTLSLGLATTSIVLNPQYLGRYLPVSLSPPAILGLDTNDVRVFYYLTLVLLVLVTFAVLGIRRSRIARALIASRDNEQAAQAFGINLFRARLQAFALSGFIAAGAGGLFAFQQHGVHVLAYTADVSLQQFLLTVVGGLGSVFGPMFGQLFAFLVVQLNVQLLSELSIPVIALVLLLFYPSGLGGLLFGIRDALLRRIAVRYRIVVPSLLADYKGDRRRTRMPFAPKTRRGGGAAFVPPEYRVPKQWISRTPNRGDQP